MIGNNCASDCDWEAIDRWVMARLGNQYKYEKCSLSHALLSTIMRHEEQEKIARDVLSTNLADIQIKCSLIHLYHRLTNLGDQFEQCMKNQQYHPDLERLADMAIDLKLDRIDPFKIAFALGKLEDELQVLRDQNALLKAKSDSFLLSAQTVNDQVDQLRRNIGMSKEKFQSYEADIQQWAINAGWLSQKIQDYKDRRAQIGSLPDYPSADELESLLETHRNLSDQSEKLNNKLQAYQSLPPDLTLAKLELARAQQRLNQMILERNRILQQFK